MRRALVHGEKSAPQPGLRGHCHSCGAEAISRCGKFVGWHWAHKSRSHCDPWWESETQWHLGWKNRFPPECQEVVLQDGTGEKHIADVRSPAGVVVEFQRSTIHPDEVCARETFYKRMVWVIDGTKNEFDATYFRMSVTPSNDDGVRGLHWIGRGKLFHRWLSHKPVFIDFGEIGFWRVCRFDPVTKRGVVMAVDRDLFAQRILNGEDFSKGGGPASLVR